jgi:hypothetical protein
VPTRDQKLAGRALRYRLTLLLLDARRPLTTAQLIAAVHPPTGRASKTVSDALRWEVRRGRVRRVARSTYAIGWIPESTARWMRWWLAESRSSVDT